MVLKAVAAAKDSLDGSDCEELMLARTGDEVLGEEGETPHPDEDVSAETWRCHWDGVAPDYGAMVEILGYRW